MKSQNVKTFRNFAIICVTDFFFMSLSFFDYIISSTPNLALMRVPDNDVIGGLLSFEDFILMVTY